jgi:hypothetical protein
LEAILEVRNANFGTYFNDLGYVGALTVLKGCQATDILLGISVGNGGENKEEAGQAKLEF